MTTGAIPMHDIADILQCPVTGGTLNWLSESALIDLKRSVDTGEVCHVDGSPVRMALDAVLATADGQLFYSVVDGVLVLMPTLALTSLEHARALGGVALAPDTERVQKFYDEVGWKGAQAEGFEDAKRWEDLRPVAADYIHKCHLRVKRFLSPSGQYLLDIASGPIQYDDYLTYSEAYTKRICADISITALKAAQKRLNDRGLYVQCDITRLPFKANVLDGFVSIHTVYHVPADRQLLAFQELERVLKPGKSGAVVYSWGPHCRLMTFLEEVSFKGLVKRCLPEGIVARLSKAPAPSKQRSPPVLYFAPQDYAWFKSVLAVRGNWQLWVWRFASIPFLQRYVREGRMGRMMLAILYWLEERMPAVLGRLGMYPLLVLRK